MEILKFSTHEHKDIEDAQIYIHLPNSKFNEYSKAIEDKVYAAFEPVNFTLLERILRKFFNTLLDYSGLEDFFSQNDISSLFKYDSSEIYDFLMTIASNSIMKSWIYEDDAIILNLEVSLQSLDKYIIDEAINGEAIIGDISHMYFSYEIVFDNCNIITTLN